MTLPQYLSYSFVDWLLHVIVMIGIVTPIVWWYRRQKATIPQPAVGPICPMCQLSISRATSENLKKEIVATCSTCGTEGTIGPGWSLEIDGGGGYRCPSCREIRTL